MTALLIIGIASLLMALAIFLRYRHSTDDGDMWAGVMFIWLLVAGMILCGVCFAVWALKNFSYVGGA